MCVVQTLEAALKNTGKFEAACALSSGWMTKRYFSHAHQPLFCPALACAIKAGHTELRDCQEED